MHDKVQHFSTLPFPSILKNISAPFHRISLILVLFLIHENIITDHFHFHSQKQHLACSESRGGG